VKGSVNISFSLVTTLSSKDQNVSCSFSCLRDMPIILELTVVVCTILFLTFYLFPYILFPYYNCLLCYSDRGIGVKCWEIVLAKMLGHYDEVHGDVRLLLLHGDVR
jgi:hypothetical protein